MKMLMVWTCLASWLPISAQAAGVHQGEAGKIQAQVTFVGPAGETVTDASGTRYTMNGSVFDQEPKIYPAKYWGTFPLYFVGTSMNFLVTLTNTAVLGNKSFKVRIEAVHRVLETSGAWGAQLAPPQTWTVESLAPGETKTLPGSAFIAYDPKLPSGLDITNIRILHLNSGADGDAGLIKEAAAVWCPPPVNQKP